MQALEPADIAGDVIANTVVAKRLVFEPAAVAGGPAGTAGIVAQVERVLRTEGSSRVGKAEEIEQVEKVEQASVPASAETVPTPILGENGTALFVAS